MGKIKNEIGNTHGFLEVFAWGKKSNNGPQYWWCYCHNDGNFVEVRGTNLRNGHTKSCGCLSVQCTTERNKLNKGRKHTEKSKRKMSEAGKGRKFSKEHRKKLGEAGKGRVVSEETRRKLSDANRNPNITDEDREDKRIKPDYQKWRARVFERDNYTCQICGQRGGKIAAHHIRNWADNPELRYDPDNGITMTKKNHKDFHSLFGYKNNTPGQLWAFMLTRGGE